MDEYEFIETKVILKVMDATGSKAKKKKGMLMQLSADQSKFA